MKYQLTNQLNATSAQTAYSRAVEMPPGDNAVNVTAASLSAGGNVTISLQESNDRENWTAAPNGSSIVLSTSTRYAASVWTGISARYVRAKILAQSATASHISVDVETTSR